MMLSNGFRIVNIPSYFRLPEEKKTLWRNLISALRSGEYTQATGRLRKPEGFCCLGVACDLVKSDKNQWVLLETLGDENKYVFSPEGDVSRDAVLPDPIARMYGMSHRGIDATIVTPAGGGGDIAISNLNDLGVTFLEIADILEKALDGGYYDVKYYETIWETKAS